MPEEEVVQQEDVQVEPSTTEEGVEEHSPAQEETSTEEQVQAQEVGQPQLDEVDEMGVPYKNRYMEAQRKLEQFEKTMPDIVQQKLEEVLAKQKTEQQPQYTIEQLEAFLLTDEGKEPANAQWALAEKRKLEKMELSRLLDEKLQMTQKQQQAQTIKSQAEKYVVEKCPECFTKDANGKLVGWNNNHPLTKLISNYMQDPRIGQQPDALAIAARLARADYLDMAQQQTQKKVQKLSAENKQIKRKTMVEGGGAESVDMSQAELQKYMERLSATGSTQDAVAVLRAQRALNKG